MAVKKIGELLVESGLITEEQLAEALAAGKDHKGVRLGAILVKMGYATEIDIAQTLSYQIGLPFVDMSSSTADPETLKLVNEKLAKQYLLVPLLALLAAGMQNDKTLFPSGIGYRNHAFAIS